MNTVVVIGASSGIACAVDLAGRGFRVFGASRTPSRRPPMELPPP